MVQSASLRVLYIHQYFRTPSMPGGTRSYEFARRLVRAGHDVQMITSDTQGLHGTAKKWTKSEEEGICVHWLRLKYSNKMRYGQRMVAFARFALAAARKAKRLGGDVVFATSTPLTVALPGVYASRRLGLPMVFEVRDLWPELPIAMGALRNPLLQRGAKWLETFAYSHSRRVIALSPGMRDGIARTGFPVEKIEVIPNGCDNESFQSSTDEGREYLRKLAPGITDNVVSYTGTLGRINGVGYLVAIAVAMLEIDPNISFLITGDGQEAEQIREKAEQAEVLNKNLWMIGTTAKKDMPKILAASTIATSLFVDLPEMWNNSANKLFDGLAAGCPIAINYRGWQAELLERSGAGIVLPPDDAQVAAASLREFLSSEERLESASSAAKELAEHEFDRDLLFQKFQSVIVSAALEKPRRRAP